MCTFDHVGIYVTSVPCVHLVMPVLLEIKKFNPKNFALHFSIIALIKFMSTKQVSL